MDDNEELLKINEQKLKYFYDNKIEVHITKKDREWLNGKIISFSKNHIVFEENKKGTMPVMLLEVFKVESFDTKYKDENKTEDDEDEN